MKKKGCTDCYSQHSRTEQSVCIETIVVVIIIMIIIISTMEVFVVYFEHLWGVSLWYGSTSEDPVCCVWRVAFRFLAFQPSMSPPSSVTRHVSGSLSVWDTVALQFFAKNNNTLCCSLSTAFSLCCRDETARNEASKHFWTPLETAEGTGPLRPTRDFYQFEIVLGEIVKLLWTTARKKEKERMDVWMDG